MPFSQQLFAKFVSVEHFKEFLLRTTFVTFVMSVFAGNIGIIPKRSGHLPKLPFGISSPPCKAGVMQKRLHVDWLLYGSIALLAFFRPRIRLPLVADLHYNCEVVT